MRYPQPRSPEHVQHYESHKAALGFLAPDTFNAFIYMGSSTHVYSVAVAVAGVSRGEQPADFFAPS